MCVICGLILYSQKKNKIDMVVCVNCGALAVNRKVSWNSFPNRVSVADPLKIRTWDLEPKNEDPDLNLRKW